LPFQTARAMAYFQLNPQFSVLPSGRRGENTVSDMTLPENAPRGESNRGPVRKVALTWLQQSW
jgi:hypothetical protein